MKTSITTIALVAGLVAGADSAMAKSASYCAGVAQNAVEGATHPAGSALLGCGAGALLGQVLTNGNGGAVIGGCAAGGATGLILSDSKRQQIYNDAYNDCMGNQANQSGPPPAPSGGAYWSASATTPYGSSSNVRSGPGTSFPIVDQLPAGTNVGVGKCIPSGWCKIGEHQWISQSLLTFN